MFNPIARVKTVYRILKGRLYKGNSLSPETEIPVILRQVDGKEIVLNLIETPTAIAHQYRVYLLQKPLALGAWSWPRLYRELPIVDVNTIDVDTIRNDLKDPETRAQNNN